jgi:hypothetical protein
MARTVEKSEKSEKTEKTKQEERKRTPRKKSNDEEMHPPIL